MKTFQDYNIQVSGTGHVRTTCPECSDKRKKSREKCLSVDIDDGVFLCHHCGFKGSLKNNFEPKEIIKHFKLPPQDIKTDLPVNVIKWFKKRGITEKTLFKNKIGFGDKRDIQFPYFKNKKIVNIKHRANPKKFWQEPNAEKCLYRLDDLIGTYTLIITEGEIDCLSFVEAGYNDVVSIPDGAPSVSAKEFHNKFDFLESVEDILKEYKRIILAVDSDAPGRLLEKELARRIGIERCYRVEYPSECKDGNDVLVKYGIDKLKNVVKTAKPFPVEGLFCASDFKTEVENLYNLGINSGFSTGWKELDEYYTIKNNEFTVITGIPGSGKSAFIDNLSVNMMTNHDWKILFFSPENWPVERHIQGLLEKTLKLSFIDTQTSKRMEKRDALETLDVIGKYFYFVYPKEGYLTVDDILEKARVAIFRYGINGIVIDPWNEVDHDYQNMTEAQYLSKSLSKIRQFAKRNAVHIWIVAHPKNLIKDKDGEYKPPTMYEISGGAHWRNKADNGLCLHRENYKNDEVTVYIQKIRFKEVGKIGEINMYYSKDVGIYL